VGVCGCGCVGGCVWVGVCGCVCVWCVCVGVCGGVCGWVGGCGCVGVCVCGVCVSHVSHSSSIIFINGAN